METEHRQQLETMAIAHEHSGRNVNNLAGGKEKESLPPPHELRGNEADNALNPDDSPPSREEAKGAYWRRKVDGRCIDNHRLVAEQMLGRKLRRGEVVHHKNGDTTDDRPENLEVMTRREHSRLHRLGHVPDGPPPQRTPRVAKVDPHYIAPDVLERYRHQLESPKVVAAELGITTAEVLARARGNSLDLHPVTVSGAVWIWRARRPDLRSATPK